MTQTIPLPSSLDVEAASALWDSVALSDGDLLLDAADLHHLSAAGLQTLLMVQRHQRGRGRMLTFVHAGTEFANRLALLGAASLLPLSPATPSGVPA